MTTEPAKNGRYALPQYSESGYGHSSKRCLVEAEVIKLWGSRNSSGSLAISPLSGAPRRARDATARPFGMCFGDITLAVGAHFFGASHNSPGCAFSHN